MGPSSATSGTGTLVPDDIVGLIDEEEPDLAVHVAKALIPDSGGDAVAAELFSTSPAASSISPPPLLDEGGHGAVVGCTSPRCRPIAQAEIQPMTTDAVASIEAPIVGNEELAAFASCRLASSETQGEHVVPRPPPPKELSSTPECHSRPARVDNGRILNPMPTSASDDPRSGACVCVGSYVTSQTVAVGTYVATQKAGAPPPVAVSSRAVDFRLGRGPGASSPPPRKSGMAGCL